MVVSLNQRVASVSTELANQLGELSNDMEELAKREPAAPATPPPPPPPVVQPEQTIDPKVLESLKQGQVKLANEQARYEIAFRQDLATLAELVKRGRS
jgi:hypothetical protein